MNFEELKSIVSLGKDSTHQFKQDVNNVKSLAAEMAAFANSKGGQIYIGISDESKITGLSVKDVNRINQLIGNAATLHLRSPIIVYTENISVGKRTVIVVTVGEGSEKPYFDSDGCVWIKCGADKRKIYSKEELRRFFQEVDALHADEVPTKADIQALDFQRLSKFLREAFAMELPSSKSKQLQLLQNMNLAKGEHINLAGLLLFALAPERFKPQFIVKAICFPGDSISDSYVDSEDFEGPLPILFKGALAFVMRNLRKIQGERGVNGLGKSEIPEAVFEELLVNALIHRDYFIDSPVRIFVFENRIEIISPGSLPNHLTVEKIKSGNSIQRNPILASFAAKGLLPYRGLGTGIIRALHDWPKIELVDSKEGSLFKSQINRTVDCSAPINDKNASLREINAPITDENASPQERRAGQKRLPEIQLQILYLLQQDKTASYEVLSAKLGRERATIRRHLQKLKANGVIERIGARKKGYWKIVEESWAQP